MAIRHDAGTLKKPVRLANGFLRVDGQMTRTGIFVYRNADGTERRELRTPEEVFKADSLASFALAPVTNDHPPELLTAANAKQYTGGTTGETMRRDGDYVVGSMMITDADLIAAIEGGKVELSCGYSADVVMTPGVYRGQKYDGFQTNIRGNHVAVVRAGRAGPEARIRLDADDAVMVSHVDNTESGTKMAKLTIDGESYEVPPEVAAAYNALVKEAKGGGKDKKENPFEKKDADDQLVKLVEQLRAKFDAETEAHEKLKKAHLDATDATKAVERVNARVSLLVQAREVLGTETKFDAMDDKTVRVAVLAKLTPAAVDLAKRSDDYVQARYDIAMELHNKSNPALAVALAGAKGAAPVVRADGTEKLSARERMMQANQGASAPSNGKK